MDQRHTWMAWLCGAVLLGCATGTFEDDAAFSADGSGNNGGNNNGSLGGNQSTGGTGGATDGSTDGSTSAPVGLGAEVFERCSTGTELPGPRLLRLLTREEYQHTIADLLYLAEPDVSGLPLEAQVEGYNNNALSQAVTSRHVDEYISLADTLAQQAVDQSIGQLVRCDISSADCQQDFVTSFGLRAFRRPLSAEEQQRYVALFAGDLTEGNTTEGVKLVIQAMLISPNFLYRSEVGTNQGDGTFRLSAYELASALSYLYWGTMPDDVLFSAAANGTLSTPEELRAQAERLMADAKAQDQLFSFSLQWLGTQTIQSSFKDPDYFPNFTDGVREAMLEEQRQLFIQAVLTDNGDFGSLFDPGYTYVDQNLANYYQVQAPGQGSGFVSTDGTPRGGILGLGAVYASHAHSNESSPIKRGLFIRSRLLCQELPDPPANLDTTPPGLDPTLTTRARFAQHTADAACSSCHQFIDDLGFGMEGFDGAGFFRTVENGLNVDTSGKLKGLENLYGDATEYNFADHQELSNLVQESQSARDCFVIQYYRFGRGYAEQESDACSLTALRTSFSASNYTVKDLLLSLPQLYSFSVRAE